MQGKMSEKKIIQGKPPQKIHAQDGSHLILNQNNNSSRKVLKKAPNRIRACPDFQNFPGEGFPPIPNRYGPPTHFNTAGVICRTQNANQNHRSKHKQTGVPFRLTGVYLALRFSLVRLA